MNHKTVENGTPNTVLIGQQISLWNIPDKYCLACLPYGIADYEARLSSIVPAEGGTLTKSKYGDVSH